MRNDQLKSRAERIVGRLCETAILSGVRRGECPTAGQIGTGSEIAFHPTRCAVQADGNVAVAGVAAAEAGLRMWNLAAWSLAHPELAPAA